jgi:chromosome transmission fidelity protein 1
MLLHRATRESCGIKIAKQVIVIDEAHNLMETVSSIHSTAVTGLQLTCAYSQLSQYQERFHARLKAKNLMYIRQLLFILSAFIKVLGGR